MAPSHGNLTNVGNSSSADGNPLDVPVNQDLIGSACQQLHPFTAYILRSLTHRIRCSVTRALTHCLYQRRLQFYFFYAIYRLISRMDLESVSEFRTPIKYVPEASLEIQYSSGRHDRT